MTGDGERAEQPGGGGTGEGPGTAGSGRSRVAVLLGIAAFVLAADVITKVIAVADLSGRRYPVHVLGSVLQLWLRRNSGAAFSIGTSDTFLYTVIAAGVIVFIARTARRLRSLPWAVTLGLLLGGAAGNLADRLFRAPGPLRGAVIDWIQLPHWPVFNLADSAIVCGGVLTVLLAMRGLRLDGTREQSGHRHPGGSQGSVAGRPPGTRPGE